jgi:ribosomal-protein-alanine N-acetyltransferase
MDPEAIPQPAFAVSLRHPVSSDEREYTALRRAHRAFLEPWEPIPSPGHTPFTSDDFERLMATARTDMNKRFLILHEADRAIIGQVSLNSILLGPMRSAFIGYWIAPTHARRGLMTQALQLALGFAFNHLLLHRVEANIQPHNAASISTILKVGFRYEGFSPKLVQIAGKYADHNRYAMLDEEFFDRYPAARRIVRGDDFSVRMTMPHFLT